MFFPYNSQNGYIQPQNNMDINQTINTLKSAQNPFRLISEMMQNNPAVQNVIKMCNGRNPQDVFYEECEKRGINPNDILKMLR